MSYYSPAISLSPQTAALCKVAAGAVQQTEDGTDFLRPGAGAGAGARAGARAGAGAGAGSICIKKKVY